MADDEKKVSDAVRQLLYNNLKNLSGTTLQQQLRNAHKEFEVVKARLALALLKEEWVLAKGLRKRRALTIRVIQGLIDNITRKAELEAEE